MKHVIYFHGFGSSPEGNKVHRLRTMYHVFAPDVPYNKNGEDALIAKVKDYLANNVSVGDQVLCVGTSLGGYFATSIGELFDIPILVFNPSVEPYFDLYQYLGTNTNYKTGEKFEFTRNDLNSFECFDAPYITSGSNSYAVLCKHDRVINPKAAFDFYNKGEFIDSNDHQFTDLNRMMSLVDKMFSEYKRENMSEGDI